jgi:hypothetical protein
MPRKTFRVAVAAEPISFDLEGPASGIQNFRCRDRMAAGTLMKFAEAFADMEDDPANPETAKAGANAIPIIRDFFNSSLMPEARDRFWAMINSDDDGIPMETLVEIAGWLAEVYSGERPTGPTSSGTSAGTSTGVDSPVTYSRPDTPILSPSGLMPASTS